MSKRENWFARNEQAEQLEDQGRLDDALALYKANESEGCDVPFTYERIASIYRKKNKIPEAVAALDRAIEIEKKRGPSERLVRLEKRRETTAELAPHNGPIRTENGKGSRSARRAQGGVATARRSGCGAQALALLAGCAALFYLLA